MKNKIGRNDPCPCGSGKKYKKCCLNGVSPIRNKELELQLSRIRAKQQQLEKQQGLGKHIISIEHNGERFIAVGNKLYHSKKWKTFHDFLNYYLKTIFGRDWGENEQKKEYSKQHPIIQWLKIISDYLKTQQKSDKQINITTMNGACAAYLNLAYDLYLLAHNAKLQNILINRLKHPDHFMGALYETQVAAMFILAGFSIELENEQDSTITHCEFIAISKSTKNKYSVEVKSRLPNKKNVGIGNQLYSALKKQTEHKRLIFIEMNIPELRQHVNDIVSEIKNKEKILLIDGKPAPSAFIFITNHSYVYSLDNCSFEKFGFVHSFKTEGFVNLNQKTNIREVLQSRKNFPDIEHLIQSMNTHAEIPSTFDGEIEIFAFDENLAKNRLMIGNKYLIPDKDGKEEIGELTSACVLEAEKMVWGVYKLDSGQGAICSTPISDDELIAYQKNKDTFFGVHINQGKKSDDPIEFFDSLYSVYKNTDREKLLSFMKNFPDYKILETLSQDELAITYCERIVYTAIQNQSK